MNVLAHIPWFTRRTTVFRACSILYFFTFICCLPVLGEGSTRRVRVGYFDNPGFNEISPDGRKKGYDYQFLSEVRKFTNLNFEYVGYDKPLNQHVEMLRNGEIDILPGVRKKPEREAEFCFSKSIGNTSTTLNVRSDEKRFDSEVYSTYDGIVIGLTQTMNFYEAVCHFASIHNFKFVPKFYPTLDAVNEALKKGEVDAIASLSFRKAFNEKILNFIDTEPMYVIARKGDEALIDQFNHAIQHLDELNHNWRDELYYKYYATDKTDDLRFTSEEQAFLQQLKQSGKPVLVATDSEWRPYSWREDGQYKGIVVDILDIAMEMAGIDYEIYAEDSDKRIYSTNVLDSAGVQIYAASSLDAYEDEKRDFISTPSYLSANLTFVQLRDNNQIRRIAICLDSPTLSDYVREKWAGRDVEYVEVGGTKEGIEAVLNGTVDGLYLYNYEAQYYTVGENSNALRIVFQSGISFPLHMTMHNDSNHLLFSILCKCLKHISQDEINNIVQHHISVSNHKVTIVDFLRQHIFSSIACILLVGFSAFFIWRRHENRSRVKIQAALRQAQEARQTAEEALRETDEARQTAENALRETEEARQTAEDALQQAEDARQMAEDANAAKTSFLFSMSHDIRTPMNAIMGFRDLLEKHIDNPERRTDYLEKIRTSSQVLLSIINNVLEMARIEKGSLEVEEVAWDSTLFNDTIAIVFDEMMKQKDIEFTRSINVTHNLVYCDPFKLREIFINILSNACKYTNNGGHVHMQLDEIPCELEGWATYRTTISDTGMGMSAEFLPHLFEEFTREHSTTEKKIEGTGLGMPIVKRLVELLGGTIEVESKKGVGSTFIVTISHRIAQPHEVEANASSSGETDGSAAIGIDGCHILMAEDNDLNAEIAMEILGETGFQVERACDGAQCVEMLQKADAGHYDVILMDVQMPVMNGYDATRAIRQLENSSRANIPIIAMTANAFEEDRRAAFEAGMNDHIAKPIDISVLMTTLKSVLNKT